MKKNLFLMLVFFIAIGCGKKTSSSIIKKDGWFNPVQRQFLGNKYVKIPDHDVAIVVSHHQEEAQMELRETNWKPISRNLALKYTGNTFDLNGNKKLVLLRGLYVDGSKSPFIVYWSEGIVWVTHGTLGSYEGMEVRRVLVAALPEYPEEVFVDLDSAD